MPKIHDRRAQRRHTVAVVAVLLATPASAVVAETPPGQGSARADSLEEVVVTATRRTERLLDIPQAVTAIGTEELEQAGIRDFADYARLVPGLTFSDLGTDRPRPQLRGVNVNIGAATVGYYLDDTPIPASVGSVRLTVIDPRLFDVARIEVLRGPQGTLYGAGSMGGTIRVITNSPNSTKLEGELRAIGEDVQSGGPGGSLDGMINLPIVSDHIALRMSGWAKWTDGFIDRTNNGVKVTSVPTDRDVGGRAVLGIEYGELKVDASLFHEEQDFNGFQTITAGANNPDQHLVQNFLFDVSEPNWNRFTLANLTAQYDLGTATLLSSTSYYNGGLSATEEGSEFLKLFVGPTVASRMTESPIARDTTEELRLTSKNPLLGKVDYVVGVFYEDKRIHRTFDWVTPAYASIVGDSNLFTGRFVDPFKQRAVFGELGFHVIPRVTLTAGGRYYHVNGYDSTVDTGVFNGGTTIATVNFDDRGTVKKLSASWKPTDQSQIYAQAAQGFRPGFGIPRLPALCDADLIARGLSTNAAEVKPDNVWNYEIGAKAERSDGRLRGALAAYRINWTGVQLALFLPCGFRYDSNAGDARINGVEFEAASRFGSGFELGWSASYTDSSYTRVTPGVGPSVGDPVLEVPKWQGSVYLQNLFRFSTRWTGLARVDAQYTGPSLLFYDTTTATAPAPLEFRDRPAVTLLNARLQTDANQWSVALFGRNLTNQIKVAGFGDSLSANIPYRPRFAVNIPRTIGIEVSRKF